MLEPERVPEVNQTKTVQVGPHRRRISATAYPPETAGLVKLYAAS